MKIALIAFTRSGADVEKKILKQLLKEGHICEAYSLGENATCKELINIETSIGAWTEKVFTLNDALVFVGATGIAVRAIGPHIKSKTKDPAVIVVDEKAQYFIPILSGHIGGANALAKGLEEALGGKAIITTATDINQVFAVDTWASTQGLYIKNIEMVKKVSANLLSEKPVLLYSRYNVSGGIPNGILEISRQKAIEVSKANNGVYGKSVAIVVSHEKFETIHGNCLQLIPKVVSVGIGCRKNIELSAVEGFLEEVLEEYKICKESLAFIASIDLKKEENALIELSDKWRIPFVTYEAKELLDIEGEFTVSDFVEKITGVDNVCERAAMRSTGGGHLILKKKSKEGVTIALAINKLMLNFS